MNKVLEEVWDCLREWKEVEQLEERVLRQEGKVNTQV